MFAEYKAHIKNSNMKFFRTLREQHTNRTAVFFGISLLYNPINVSFRDLYPSVSGWYSSHGFTVLIILFQQDHLWKNQSFPVIRYNFSDITPYEIE